MRDEVAAQLILQAWLDDPRTERHRWHCLMPRQTLRRARRAHARRRRLDAGVRRHLFRRRVDGRAARAADRRRPPLGFIDVSFYRDDIGRNGLKPEVKRTELPFDVEGATIVLVDDVLYTGRTVRAAMNELFDYGRPARVELAVLVDRGGRELPVEPTYVGARLAVARDLSIVLSRDAERH